MIGGLVLALASLFTSFAVQMHQVLLRCVIHGANATAIDRLGDVRPGVELSRCVLRIIDEGRFFLSTTFDREELSRMDVALKIIEGRADKGGKVSLLTFTRGTEY